MPVYEYYCRACQTKFEQLRPMKMSDQTAVCPSGHAGATRMISIVAAIGRDDAISMGGCACGGACSCSAH